MLDMSDAMFHIHFAIVTRPCSLVFYSCVLASRSSPSLNRPDNSLPSLPSQLADFQANQPVCSFQFDELYISI